MRPGARLSVSPLGGRRPGAASLLGAAVAVLIASGCGEEKGASQAPPSLPAVADVRIVPSRAYVGSILSAEVRAKDPEGRRVEFLYQWLRNGAEIPGATAQTLRAPAFRRGNELAVQVTPVVAGRVRGPSATSPSITILNSVPSIVSLTVTPGAARREDNLTVHVEARDPDDDMLVYTYQWLRNRAEIPGATGPTLAARDLRKGDKITVRVTASDREATTPPFESSPVTILNAPPRVVAPPRGRSTPDGELTYQVTAEDPDGDPLTFTLSPDAPKGMTINPTNGTILWRPRTADVGTHRFTVTISDGDGGVVRQEVVVSVGEQP